jgi:hypothetical protein
MLSFSLNLTVLADREIPKGKLVDRTEFRKFYTDKRVCTGKRIPFHKITTYSLASFPISQVLSVVLSLKIRNYKYKEE